MEKVEKEEKTAKEIWKEIDYICKQVSFGKKLVLVSNIYYRFILSEQSMIPMPQNVGR